MKCKYFVMAVIALELVACAFGDTSHLGSATSKQWHERCQAIDAMGSRGQTLSEGDWHFQHATNLKPKIARMSSWRLSSFKPTV